MSGVFYRDLPLRIAENLARYAVLGGRVALGTDFGAEGEMPVAEMQVLVEGGLTPAQVLVAATKHGAEAMNQGAELGTLEPGKLADVIVVDGDPLSDISAMANVRVVIRDGEVIPSSPSPAPPAAGHGPTDGPRVTAALIAAVAAMLGAIGALPAGSSLFLELQRLVPTP